MPQIHPFSTSTLQLDVYAEVASHALTQLPHQSILEDAIFSRPTGMSLLVGIRLPENCSYQLSRRSCSFGIASLHNRLPHLAFEQCVKPCTDGSGNPRWIEPFDRRLTHLEDSRLAIDVVMLPLVNTDNCVTNLGFGWESRNIEPHVEPGSPVSLVVSTQDNGCSELSDFAYVHVVSHIHVHPDHKHFLFCAMTRKECPACLLSRKVVDRLFLESIRADIRMNQRSELYSDPLSFRHSSNQQERFLLLELLVSMLRSPKTNALVRQRNNYRLPTSAVG